MSSKLYQEKQLGEGSFAKFSSDEDCEGGDNKFKAPMVEAVYLL